MADEVRPATSSGQGFRSVGLGETALLVAVVVLLLSIYDGVRPFDLVWTPLTKAVVGFAGWVPGHALYLLSFFPAALALYYYACIARRTYASRRKSVEDYAAYRRAYDRFRGGRSVLTSVPDENVEKERQPRLREFLAGALVLTIPFLVVAALYHSFQTTVFGLGSSPSKDTAFSGIDGIRGTVLAGFGAFAYLLALLIHRVNTHALSAKFLLTSAARTFIALVLGFLAGGAGLFGFLEDGPPKSLLYFAVGAFPSFAMASLRRKAREVFKRPAPGTEPLSLELIDGVDDMTAERLGEVGISDIQHLSTTEPGELTLRTLYPLERVIDWIDQAILATYLRNHMTDAQALGLRGAIDMRGLYKQATRTAPSPEGAAPRADVAATPSADATKGGAAPGAAQPSPPSPDAARDDTASRNDDHARKLLDALAANSKLSLDAVYSIGAALVNDYQVEFLSHLWHRRRPPEGLSEAVEQAVHAALQAPVAGRGSQTFGECLVDVRGGGPVDEQLEQLEHALRDELDLRLRSISLRWTGLVTDFADARTVDDVERETLRRITCAVDTSRLLMLTRIRAFLSSQPAA